MLSTIYDQKEKIAVGTVVATLGISVFAHSISTTNLCKNVARLLMRSNCEYRHLPSTFPHIKVTYPYCPASSKIMCSVWKSIIELSYWPERCKGLAMSTTSSVHSPTLNTLHPAHFWAASTGKITVDNRPILDAHLLTPSPTLYLNFTGLCWGSTVYFNSLINELTCDEIQTAFTRFQYYQPAEVALLQAIYSSSFSLIQYNSTKEEKIILTRLYLGLEISPFSEEISEEFRFCFEIACHYFSLKNRDVCLIQYASSYAKQNKIDQTFDFQSEIHTMHKFFRTFPEYRDKSIDSVDMITQAVTSLIDHSYTLIASYKVEQDSSFYLECTLLSPGKYALIHNRHSVAFIMTEDFQAYLLDSNVGLISISSESKFNKYIQQNCRSGFRFSIYEMKTC